ncbi:MAG TPA: hypothetical protein VMW75_11600 [Thermoanaerobaculia bacterium]|nr:hypothetical protein [Thermoanaerobaculia bacterium]
MSFASRRFVRRPAAAIRGRQAVLAVLAALTVAAGPGAAAAGAATAAAAGKTAPANGCGEIKGPLQMCTGVYALCDAAICTPIPQQKGVPGSSPTVQPTHALCECVVESGQNLGPGPCSNRPQTGKYILSTYSFALPEDHYLSCPAGGERTVCFGYPCIIDEHNPKLAHCTCPIKYDSKAFMTQGGKCKPEACSGLWQGGTPAEYACINKIFEDATGQAPPASCQPGTKP